MSIISVLIVDDDPDVLRSIGDYFERRGYAVHSASSGEEGLQMYERTRPDVTLLDVAMPGKSGLEVLAELRARQATVVMLTGVSEIAVAVQAMRAGAENFLTKPVDMVHLVAAVNNAAEKAMLRHEVVTLRRRLKPELKRRGLRWALVVILVVLSVVVGMVIGGRHAERQRAPIPIPFDTIEG